MEIEIDDLTGPEIAQLLHEHLENMAENLAFKYDIPARNISLQAGKTDISANGFQLSHGESAGPADIHGA